MGRNSQIWERNASTNWQNYSKLTSLSRKCSIYYTIRLNHFKNQEKSLCVGDRAKNQYWMSVMFSPSGSRADSVNHCMRSETLQKSLSVCHPQKQVIVWAIKAADKDIKSQIPDKNGQLLSQNFINSSPQFPDAYRLLWEEENMQR